MTDFSVQTPDVEMLNLSSRVFGADPKKLARLLSAELEQQNNWQPEELSAILRHQLEAPLEIDLGGAKSVRQPLAAGGGPDLAQLTFHDLLHQAKPEVELLRLVKEFAKVHLSPARSLLPHEIAHVLYYASIVVAR